MAATLLACGFSRAEPTNSPELPDEDPRPVRNGDLTFRIHQWIRSNPTITPRKTDLARIDLANRRRDKVLVGFNEDDADGLRVWMQVNNGPKFKAGTHEFETLVLPLLKVEAIEENDQVLIEPHAALNRGYIMRALRVPYANAAFAPGMTESRAAAIRGVERLTEFGAAGHEVTSPLDASNLPIVVRRAARNSARVADGSGLLIRWGDRVFVSTARHVVLRSLPRVPVTFRQRLHRASLLADDRESDLAILEFVDSRLEYNLSRGGWGYPLGEWKPERGTFVFQLGFPNDWPLNQRHAARWRRGEETRPEDRFQLVLTSGVSAGTGDVFLMAECPSVSGNSGGGLFTIDETGVARLVGIAHGTTFGVNSYAAEINQAGHASHVPAPTILRLLETID